MDTIFFDESCGLMGGDDCEDVKPDNGGIFVTKSAIEKQKSDKNWRPLRYYEILSKRFHTSWSYEYCEKIGWEKALWTIFRHMYTGDDEDVGHYELGQLIPRSVEIMEFRSSSCVSSDCVFCVPPEYAIDTAERIIEYWHCPISYGDVSKIKSHKELIELILRDVSTHWIVEMYILFARYSDICRCHIVKWDYSK